MFLTFAMERYATTQILPRPLKAELVAIAFVLASLAAYLASQAAPITAAGLALGLLILMLAHGITARQIFFISVVSIMACSWQYHRLSSEDCLAIQDITGGARHEILATITRIDTHKRLMLATLAMPPDHLSKCPSTHIIKIETFQPALLEQIYGEHRVFFPGDVVSLRPSPVAEPVARPRSALFPGRFDQRAYLHHFKVFYVFQIRSIDIIARAKSDHANLEAMLDRMRRSLAAMHETALGPRRGALMTSMVIGDKVIDLPREIVDDFRQAGLSHLLSASGLNLAILSGALALVFKQRGPFFLAVHFALMGLFAVLAGLGASICRAAMMSLAGHFLRPLIPGISTGFIFALVAAIALAIDPFVAGDLGFVFSYLACAGIIHLLPALDRLIDLYCNFKFGSYLDSNARFKRWTIEPTLLVACSLAACLPFQAAIFKTASAWTFAANFLVEPLVVPISTLGFATSTLFCIDAQHCRPLCLLLDSLASPLLDVALSIAHFFAGLPLHDLSLAPPDNLAIVLYGLSLASFAIRFHLCRERYTRKATRSLGQHFLLAGAAGSILFMQCLCKGVLVEIETRPGSISIHDGDRFTVLHLSDKIGPDIGLIAAPYILHCDKPRAGKEAPYPVLTPDHEHALAWALPFIKPQYLRHPTDTDRLPTRRLIRITLF